MVSVHNREWQYNVMTGCSNGGQAATVRLDITHKNSLLWIKKILGSRSSLLKLIFIINLWQVLKASRKMWKTSCKATKYLMKEYFFQKKITIESNFLEKYYISYFGVSLIIVLSWTSCFIYIHFSFLCLVAVWQVKIAAISISIFSLSLVVSDRHTQISSFKGAFY